jgi:hypothetical protein
VTLATGIHKEFRHFVSPFLLQAPRPGAQRSREDTGKAVQTESQPVSPGQMDKGMGSHAMAEISSPKARIAGQTTSVHLTRVLRVDPSALTAPALPTNCKGVDEIQRDGWDQPHKRVWVMAQRCGDRHSERATRGQIV